jgi:hypothetical protein
MKFDYPKIKKFLQIGVFSFNLLIFLLILFSTNSKSKSYKEYTNSSKFFLCFYIMFIFGFLITITIYTALLYYKIKKYILFAFTDKGKIIISYLISLIFLFSRNKPQLVFAILSIIATTLLLIYEFIFHFQKIENYLNNRGIEFINRKKTTIDMNNLEKKENLDKNDISGIQYNKNNSINNNIIVDKNSNQQNQQIVDVVSGYD